MIFLQYLQTVFKIFFTFRKSWAFKTILKSIKQICIMVYGYLKFQNLKTVEINPNAQI